MTTSLGRVAALLFVSVLGAPTFAGAQWLESVTPLHTFDGPAAGDALNRVRNLGDLDGDGVNDIGVGSPANNDNGAGAGKVWIFSGATGDTIRTHVRAAGSHFGYSLASIGDVNGDDVPEYVVSAPRTLNFLTFNTGTARVLVFDGATGVRLKAWTDANFGLNQNAGFGCHVSGAGHTLQGGAGDVDNDGVPDVVFATNIGGGGTSFLGTVWVASGADLATIIWTFTGEAVADLFGWGGAGLGDINGDGHADLIVGSPDAGPTNQGRAYVYSGQTGLQFPFSPLEPDSAGVRFGFLFAEGPGDLNGDGTPDFVVSDFLDTTLGPATGALYAYSGVDGARFYKVTGDTAGGSFGIARGCGDVNFDGRADLVAAAFTSSEGDSAGGRGLVLSGADGSVLRTITSTIKGDTFGIRPVGLGDLDGDGALDFGFGVPGHDTNGAAAGRVYVIAGDILPPVAAPVVTASRSGFELLGGTPNPARQDVRIDFRAPSAATVRISIHDVAGRRVATVYSGSVAAGSGAVRWDGRDDSGRTVPAGVYFARLTAPGFDDAKAIVRLR